METGRQYFKKVNIRLARELLTSEIMPRKNYDTFLPDQVFGHAFELLEAACKRSKKLDDLRWNICNGSGIKAHDKEAFKRGEYYTCTISGRCMGGTNNMGDRKNYTASYNGRCWTTEGLQDREMIRL